MLDLDNEPAPETALIGAPLAFDLSLGCYARTMLVVLDTRDGHRVSVPTTEDLWHHERFGRHDGRPITFDGKPTCVVGLVAPDPDHVGRWAWYPSVWSIPAKPLPESAPLARAAERASLDREIAHYTEMLDRPEGPPSYFSGVTPERLAHLRATRATL